MSSVRSRSPAPALSPLPADGFCRRFCKLRSPFGPMFAAEIRKRRIRKRAYSIWRWHLDETFVWINGKRICLWRAVDHESEVLKVFAKRRRDRRAVLNFLRRAMKRYCRANCMVTDRLRSYGAAMKAIDIQERQICDRRLNNRAENLHQSLQRREAAMAKFSYIRVS